MVYPMSQSQAPLKLDLAGQLLEYRHYGPAPDAAPCFVLLHEGLGCVALWGDFPERLAAATGWGVFVYSRAGYGASSPVPLPRRLDYMEREAADTLPRLLDAIGFTGGVLLGHSDGASIATLFAGAGHDPRLSGLVLIAPHFFVEDVTVAAIAEAKRAYETTDLRAKLARYHDAVDIAFRGWCDVWLDPRFRAWDITAALPGIAVPVQIIQGADDQYGTLRQIEAARALCRLPPDIAILPGIRHTPHREAAQAVLDLVINFVATLPASILPKNEG
jgi:pimeloyl-ACP methyl ester carboxylesterase